MEILFKNIDEIQECLKINATFPFSDIVPYIELVQLKHLPKYLGNGLLSELLGWYHEETLDEESAFMDLLPFVQKVVANFAIQLASADLDLELTSSGFAVVQNQNLVPASEARVKKFLDNREKIAFEWVEQLLKYLEDNQEEDEFDSWFDSDACTLNRELFINSAKVFDSFINIDESRLLFSKWFQTMKEIELLIIYPGISKELAEVIKTQVINENVSSANQPILELVKRSLANFTAGKMWKDKDMYLSGQNFLVEAKKIMDADPDTYPEYKESSVFIENRDSYNLFDNSDGAFFLMGGGHPN